MVPAARGRAQITWFWRWRSAWFRGAPDTRIGSKRHPDRSRREAVGHRVRGWPPSPVRAGHHDPPPPPPRCQAALRAHGAHIQLIDVGPVDHNTSLILAFPKLLAWFQHLS